MTHSWASTSLEARISAHVHAWEKARHKGKPLTPETFPFVTISREYGCEAVPLSLRLVDTLNERCRPSFPWVAYDRELLDKVAEELHLHRGVVESIDGHRRGEMSELFDSILHTGANATTMFRKFAEIVRALAIHGHAVMVGRGSYLITQDLKTGLHIRLVAPLDWRVHKVAHDRELSRDEAQRLVEESSRQRDHFIESFFARDAGQPFHHDLIIDNSRFNLDQIVELVFTALGARFGERLVGA